jgi:ribonuclease Z
MKFWKAILVVIILGSGLYFSLLIPFVQDLVIKTAVSNLATADSPFPEEDALSALICGSRSPLPSPGRAQTCVAVKAGEDIFIVDIGDGGNVNLGKYNVPTNQIKAVLFTHLHSDHISDLADLHLATWLPGRPKALSVYGPEGTDIVTAGFEMAYKLDYGFRNEHHGEALAPIKSVGFKTTIVDLNNPIIYNENGLKITAFKVTHEPIEPALGYRFDYKGRSLVITGDTSYDENIALNSKNADVLIAEAQANHIINIMQKALLDQDPNQPLVKVLEDIKTYHMTPMEAAKLANMANVKHLIFYHLTPAPRNGIMENVFVRGVDDIRTDWTLSRDGTFVVLPVGKEQINLSDLN